MGSDTSQFPYKKAVLGGTFDRLHAAHRSLLKTAVTMAKDVFVGVVSEELGEKLFTKKEFADMIEPYDKRKANVVAYLQKLASPEQEVVVDALYDPWGPAPHDPVADVIVVSTETEKTGHIINQMRREKDLVELDIIVIPDVFEEGELVSSTRKRREEIQTKGKLEP